MSTFLLCDLYAPMASWGDIAMGETRGSWPWPSRSAWLGLVGAAFGIDREDDVQQRALDAELGFAVAVLATGQSAQDYHTALAVPQSLLDRAGPVTRGQSLRLGTNSTVLSRRRYWTDCLYAIACWQRPGGRWSAQALQAALRQPRFSLYAGRKAHPLGLPLDPRIVEQPTLADAFQSLAPRYQALGFDRAPFRSPPGDNHDNKRWLIAYDAVANDGVSPGLSPHQIDVRRDRPTSRRHWTFGNREVRLAMLAATPQTDDGAAP
jgi:CRISPR system Cascade subunit CasD